MHVDLHTHTSASDGSLNADELMRRARDRGVTLMSLTDHDTVAAYRDLEPLQGLTIIPGIELSTCLWGIGLHVLGLGIDPAAQSMESAVEYQSNARSERAGRIRDRLIKKGLSLPQAEPTNHWVGRPWFAQHLVSSGQVRDAREAYRKYLGPGRIGDVKQYWAPLHQIIDWIHGAGGLAVLAHPSRYRLTNTKLGKLLDEFQGLGGDGIEVVCGHQNVQRSRYLAEICERRHMLASCGSDFHHPGQTWSEPGRYSRLPEVSSPIWERWQGIGSK